MEWQPIETAPKDGTSVLLCAQKDWVGEGRYHESHEGWWWASCDPTDAWDGQAYEASHWMPLPEPPK